MPQCNRRGFVREWGGDWGSSYLRLALCGLLICIYASSGKYKFQSVHISHTVWLSRETLCCRNQNDK